MCLEWAKLFFFSLPVCFSIFWIKCIAEKYYRGSYGDARCFFISALPFYCIPISTLNTSACVHFPVWIFRTNAFSYFPFALSLSLDSISIIYKQMYVHWPDHPHSTYYTLCLVRVSSCAHHKLKQTKRQNMLSDSNCKANKIVYVYIQLSEGKGKEMCSSSCCLVELFPDMYVYKYNIFYLAEADRKCLPIHFLHSRYLSLSPILTAQCVVQSNKQI